jgi:hypothetical protein
MEYARERKTLKSHFVEFDERVLQRLARATIANDLATFDRTETCKDDFQILQRNPLIHTYNSTNLAVIETPRDSQRAMKYLVCRDRIQLAHEEHIIRCFLVGIMQIADL